MKIKQDVALITGSHGFLGGHLQAYLKTKNIVCIPLARSLLTDHTQLTIYLEQLKPDYIFHLAAYGNHYYQKDVSEAVTTNYGGTYNLLTASHALNYKAFVNVSTSALLLPQETFYTATKRGAESLCRAFAHEYGKPIVNARPYSLYGPNEADFRFIPTVFRACLQREVMKLDPDPIHDWLYITSFVEALWKCAQHVDKYKGKTLNMGTGIGTTNKQIVEMIEGITDKRAQVIQKKGLRSYDNQDWACKADDDTYLWDKEDIPLVQEGLKRYYDYQQGS